MKSLKMFTICEICPADHLKAKKIGVAGAVSSLFAILCFLPLSQIWSCDFFYQLGLRRALSLTVQQILDSVASWQSFTGCFLFG